MTTSKNNIIACATGHSGGHIVPCLTLALENKPEQIIFFSSTSALDRQLLATNAQVSTHVPLHVHPARRWYLLPVQLFHMALSFCTSLWRLHTTKPDKIISTGGLVSIPVCLAAWVLRIPIELYELNAVPGKAIKFLTPFASVIYVCFEKAQAHFDATKCKRFSYPIRFKIEDSIKKDKVIDELKLLHQKKTIFILGGSQGSQFINQAIARALADHPALAAQIQIIHQTGASDQTDYRALYAHLGIPAHLFAFDNHLARYYAAADLIIARAGAGTIFETVHFKTPCILIPLETKATDHQVDNAKAIAAEFPAQFTMVKQLEIERNSDILAQTILKQLSLGSSKETVHEISPIPFDYSA